MYKGTVYKFGLLFIFSLLIVRCSPSGGGGTVESLTVHIDCQTSKCQNSVVTAPQATTVFSLSGCSATTIDYELIASGYVNAVCNQTNCNGVINTWRDKNGASISQIEARTYYICSWIDLNNNGIKDSADDYSQLTQMVNSSSVLTISSWGATFSM